MAVPVIAVFNNKGRLRKTSLVYHLAWMFADLGSRVVAADFDPQANLTSAFLDEDRIEELLSGGRQHRNTVYGSIEPFVRGVGDVAIPYLERIDDSLALVLGDLALSCLEDELSRQWLASLGREDRALRVLSAFWRVVQMAADRVSAGVVFMDLGPNLGAINRIAVVSSDYVIVPLAPDLFSLQALENIGPALRRWREEWQERLPRNPARDLELPSERTEPLGYVVMQPSVRLDRRVKSYDRCIARIPEIYREAVLSDDGGNGISVDKDPHCLAVLKHYPSLMQMAQEARKPVFFLKPADGALGAHTQAVQDTYRDFKKLALEVARRAGVELR
jgi:cellulose biosynthesis protein BcsQ